MSARIPVIVLGGTGYVAGEVLRLVLGHSQFELTGVLSDSQPGESVGKAFPHLAAALGDLAFESQQTITQRVTTLPRSAIFSAAPHGVSAALIAHFRGRIPILGVCLGHQTIGDCHGMLVRRNDEPVHGKTSEIHHDGRGLFAGMSNPFVATRYHSLVVDPATIHQDFERTAWTARGEVMGLRWKAPPGASPLEGVQFHPESFLTVEGPRLLANFLGMR